MGIERFFNSLAKNETITENGIVLGLKDKINANYLYIDFNSVIYTSIAEIEAELNYLLYSIILFVNDSIEFDEKTLVIAKKWKFDVRSDTADNLIKKFTEVFLLEFLNNSANNNIKTNVINIITQLIASQDLSLVHIDVDGVPQMSKIIEQKKRRYNGYVISKIRNKIAKKYEHEMTKNKQLYEEHKISFDRSKIIAWTDFMDGIMNVLMTKEFKDAIQEKAPHVNEIIISHKNVPGEGEKKIIEHILESKQKGDYVIFSPDADMILLAMIALYSLNNESTMTVLRYNQQTEEYDSININVLCDNIYNYM